MPSLKIIFSPLQIRYVLDDPLQSFRYEAAVQEIPSPPLRYEYLWTFRARDFGEASSEFVYKLLSMTPAHRLACCHYTLKLLGSSVNIIDFKGTFFEFRQKNPIMFSRKGVMKPY